MIITIDTEQQTIDIDGSGPQPYENMEQVCEMLESMGGESEAPDMAAQEQAGMEEGFKQARGVPAGM